MAWEALDKEEKEEILSLFPDNQHILSAGTDQAQPDFVSLMNDDSFRYDCAAYVENMAQGRHDLEWLASAWSAHEQRKTGDFDEFLESKFEEEWGVEVPENMKANRAASGAPSSSLSTAPSATDEIVVKTTQERAAGDQDDPKNNEDDREGDKSKMKSLEDEVMGGTEQHHGRSPKHEKMVPENSQDGGSKMVIDAMDRPDELA